MCSSVCAPVQLIYNTNITLKTKVMLKSTMVGHFFEGLSYRHLSWNLLSNLGEKQSYKLWYRYRFFNRTYDCYVAFCPKADTRVGSRKQSSEGKFWMWENFTVFIPLPSPPAYFNNILSSWWQWSTEQIGQKYTEFWTICAAIFSLTLKMKIPSNERAVKFNELSTGRRFSENFQRSSPYNCFFREGKRSSRGLDIIPQSLMLV